MIAWGKNKSESRVTAEFYNCAVEVMRGAEAIDEYIALPEQEAFDIEYWLLEEAKLKRMPPEKSLARRIVLVVGAGSGIGRQAAHRLAAEGAHVVCADLDVTAAEQTAHELTTRHGHGIGVAGSGISGCGPAIAVALDMKKRESIRAAIRQTLLEYGGLDHLVITAGIYVSPRSDGTIADEAWGLTYDVNVIGPYLVADEARKVWQAQGLTGSMVLTTSVNGMVAKKGSLAYDSSKGRPTTSCENWPLSWLADSGQRRSTGTVVSGSSMFLVSGHRLIVKYGISFEPSIQPTRGAIGWLSFMRTDFTQIANSTGGSS
jgi:NAD(P)-dependent dehydrogenase (short-subunit alcohol dehydrogenase family)